MDDHDDGGDGDDDVDDDDDDDDDGDDGDYDDDDTQVELQGAGFNRQVQRGGGGYLAMPYCAK